jgi:PDZ domain-containing secreted protein
MNSAQRHALRIILACLLIGSVFAIPACYAMPPSEAERETLLQVIKGVVGSPGALSAVVVSIGTAGAAIITAWSKARAEQNELKAIKKTIAELQAVQSSNVTRFTALESTLTGVKSTVEHMDGVLLKMLGADLNG